MRRALIATAAVALGLAAVPPAHADESGSAVGTVSVGVRSITVTPDTFSFDVCQRQNGTVLVFPNDTCGGVVTITNGNAPSHVYVRATDFQGSEGGTPWDLCSEAACSGEDGRPGVDQARLQIVFGVDVSNSDTCDDSWSSTGCEATPGQSVTENLWVTGPESTTNGSPMFSTTLTWSALP